MTTFFTSDTHFGHARILELSNRPFKDVQHMNEMLIANWNSVVSPTDRVYHLGDVALGTFEESMKCVARLNGYKILVMGNHDRLFHDPEVKNRDKAETYFNRFRPVYETAFDEVIEGTYEKAAEAYIIPEMKVNLSTGDSEAQAFRMSHFPYTGDSHDKPRYDIVRPKDDGKVLLHGHTHASEKLSESAGGTQQIHVGVDSWHYFPVSLETILKLVRK